MLTKAYEYTDRRGNRVLIGICAANIVLYLFTFLFYRSLNQRREKNWTSMTPKVWVSHSLKTSSDMISTSNGQSISELRKMSGIKGWIFVSRIE